MVIFVTLQDLAALNKSGSGLRRLNRWIRQASSRSRMVFDLEIVGRIFSKSCSRALLRPSFRSKYIPIIILFVTDASCLAILRP